MSKLKEEALKIHLEHRGKLAVKPKVPVNDAKDLSLVYSPGVAAPCLEIHKIKTGCLIILPREIWWL